MKKYGILALIALTGCSTPPAEAAKTLATNVKNDIYETSYKIHDWAMTPPKEALPPQDVATSYCYRALQDIMCYRQPMPGWENRLVAYQGTNAVPPSPSQMVLLPKRKEDTSILPANRVASSKPVFETLPTLPKEGEKSSDSPSIDSSREILPDPALAPEL